MSGAQKHVDDTRITIIGGGIAGCSLAYHLTEAGCGDVVLLEQDEITSGSTWHAAGLCTQYIGSCNLARLLRYSVGLYQSLENEPGQQVGFHSCGSLRLATSPGHLDEFAHRAGIAELAGIPFEVVSARRAAELFPLMEPSGILGAAYLPTDGHVDPASVAMTLLRAAKAKGARIARGTPVTGLSWSHGGWTVDTAGGSHRSEIVVIAAGQWARQVARMAGADLPIAPLQHQYVVTGPVPELRGRSPELPVLRDPRGSFYIRQEGEGLLVGPFERRPLPWALDRIPEGFHGRLLPPDLDQIQDVLADAAERVPAFGHAGIRSVVNGPDGYTPDGRCLMGWIPGARNLFALAGFSIFGIVFGGGAGKYAAEWILDGQPSDDMWELDVSRFGPYAASTRYIVSRAADVYEREYAIHYPYEERPVGRLLKTGPLHDRLLGKGARYGVRFGWERPLWFPRPGETGNEEPTFRKPPWHAAVGRECRAVQTGAGILDQTSFAKFEVSGPGAESFLDRLSANILPSRTGRIALTQMCTSHGGIECDLTITRTGEERFYVVSAAATETHDYAWMQRHAPADDSVRIDNLTARLAVLTIAGPRSRELLQALSDDDWSSDAFPFFSARQVHIGMAPVLALRVSYVGELGYELHHPAEYQRYIYDLLWSTGNEYGLADFGYQALDSMRLEKAYRLWGSDISPDYTPIEAGLDRFVRTGKGDFIGREALLRQENEGCYRRLSILRLDEADAFPHGQEPVYYEGKVVSHVTSGGYGHRVGTCIALAYLPPELAEPGTAVEVAVLGQRRKALVTGEPLYDPANARLLQ
ncbi:MAG TPA: FAD-dependent oxidoreductase [Streptosporangiaceae bacterium]|nr:FAD-dependent oxidoreductase [Streptosporangiaceae bacterium]